MAFAEIRKMKKILFKYQNKAFNYLLKTKILIWYKNCKSITQEITDNKS